MAIDIGVRLKKARKLSGLSQKGVYERLGVAQSTYSSWETGKSEPDLATAKAICETLNVSMDEFLSVKTSESLKTTLRPDEFTMIESYRYLDKHGKEVVNTLLTLEKNRFIDVPEAVDLGKSVKIPFKVYTQKASAGFGNYLCEDSEFDIYELEAEAVHPKAQFGIRISGVSMEPKILDGQIVFVEPAVQLENNEIGIFVYDGEAFCKMLRIDYENEEILLLSLNEDYSPIRVTDPDALRTIGKVVGQYSENMRQTPENPSGS